MAKSIFDKLAGFWRPAPGTLPHEEQVARRAARKANTSIRKHWRMQAQTNRRKPVSVFDLVARFFGDE